MKHLIIVKWNDSLDKEDMFFKANEDFKKVIEIDGVSEYKIIKSNSDKTNRSDLIIEITCTKEGLDNYDKSSLHKAWKDNYSSYIFSKAIFDYDE